MLKVSVTKAKSVKCLIIELLKVIAVPMAAVITEDAGVLVSKLLVKVDCVLNTRSFQTLSKTNTQDLINSLHLRTYFWIFEYWYKLRHDGPSLHRAPIQVAEVFMSAYFMCPQCDIKLCHLCLPLDVLFRGCTQSSSRSPIQKG